MCFITMARDGELWLGMSTSSRDCTAYTWIDGKAVDWTHWGLNEPNGCTNSQCVRIKKTKWKTISCSYKYPFICEGMFKEF